MLIGSAIGLIGCSAPPTREDVAERFLIELTDSEDLRAGLQELSLGIADDMLAGNCGEVAYETGLGEDADLVYAWKVTCLMMFEGDLTEAQINEAKMLVAERAVDG
ncbi:hypothetical protein NS234_07410 [Microbacterium oxydans]|nr:hypothetical protein NS234_07410 [Microbacterium oxydans]